jgi:hypothetical protein
MAGRKRRARGGLEQATVHEGAQSEKFTWTEHAGKRVRVLTGRCEPIVGEPRDIEELVRSGEVEASPRSVAWASAVPWLALEDGEIDPSLLPLRRPLVGAVPASTQMTLFGTPASCARPSPSPPIQSDSGGSSDDEGIGELCRVFVAEARPEEPAVTDDAALEEHAEQALEEILKDPGIPAARATAGRGGWVTT